MDVMKLLGVAQDAQKTCLGKSELLIQDTQACMEDLMDAATHVSDIVSQVKSGDMDFGKIMADV